MSVGRRVSWSLGISRCDSWSLSVGRRVSWGLGISLSWCISGRI